MSVSFSVAQEQSKFDPTYLCELYILDGTAIGLQTIYYFCGVTSQNFQPVVFNGITFTPFPIILQDNAADGKGSLNRPKLTVSNIHGFVSALLLQNQQLNGATITRRRVFARYIDAVNFPGGQSPYSPNPSAAYPDESWVVNRKITENQQVVQWELVSPLELQSVKLPRRQIIANTCTAPVKYRDPITCGYSGLPSADSANKAFGAGGYNWTVTDLGIYNPATTYSQGNAVFVYSSLPQFAGIKIYYVCSQNGIIGVNPVGNGVVWIADQCAKSPAACGLRFDPQGVPRRFGGFMGTTRSPWLAQI